MEVVHHKLCFSIDWAVVRESPISYTATFTIEAYKGYTDQVGENMPILMGEMIAVHMWKRVVGNPFVPNSVWKRAFIVGSESAECLVANILQEGLEYLPEVAVALAASIVKEASNEAHPKVDPRHN